VNASTLSVRFDRHEVAIRSAVPDALAALHRSFRYMVGNGPALRVAQIELGQEGDRYVGRSPGGKYDRAGTLSHAVRWVRYQAIEQLILARPDLLWLHGAVAGWRGRAVLMPGPRGRGKSTLVTQLCQRGWTFLTDDIVPVDPASLEVRPFPQLPAVRPNPGRELPETWLRDAEKAEVAVDDRVGAEPLPVGVLVLPAARRSGNTELRPCSPAEAVLELARGCWNFAEHGERAVAILARLGANLPAFRMAFRDADRAADLIGAWARSAWSS
jgi:hypothetical protein